MLHRLGLFRVFALSSVCNAHHYRLGQMPIEDDMGTSEWNRAKRYPRPAWFLSSSADACRSSAVISLQHLRASPHHSLYVSPCIYIRDALPWLVLPSIEEHLRHFRATDLSLNLSVAVSLCWVHRQCTRKLQMKAGEAGGGCHYTSSESQKAGEVVK